MEAIHHNPMMNPNIVLNADDEMMDSDYEHRIQQDEDYDIDLEGGDAYSNMGMDEEMKFDTAEDMAYDNDDLMLDETDYQTANVVQEEEIVFLDAQQPERVNIESYEVNSTYELKDIRPVNTIHASSAPIASRQNGVDVQPAIDISVNMNSDPVSSTQHQEYESVHAHASVAGDPVQEQKTELQGTQDTEVHGEPQEQQEQQQELLESPMQNSQLASEGNNEQAAEDARARDPSNEDGQPVMRSADEESTNNQQSPQTEIHKMHPVIVHFEGNTLSLFNSEFYNSVALELKAASIPDQSNSEAYADIPTMYLLNDGSLATKGFDELFTALREMFADEIGEDAELTIEIDELELFLHEDNLLTKSISLSDLIDLYLRLCHQDRIQQPHPMYITLSTQPRFTKRYSELLTAAGEGKGISQVHTYGSVQEFKETASVHSAASPPARIPAKNLGGPLHLNPEGEIAEDSGQNPQPARRPSAAEAEKEFVLVAKEPPDYQVEAKGDNNGGEDFPEEIYRDEGKSRKNGTDMPRSSNPLPLQTSPEVSNLSLASGTAEEASMETRITASEIVVEEVIDDAALNAQSAEEIDEPEDSIATEVHSITEVTVETANEEEELLEYEEENEEGVALNGSSPNVEYISNENGQIDNQSVRESTDETIVGEEPGSGDGNNDSALDPGNIQNSKSESLPKEQPSGADVQSSRAGSEEPQHIPTHQFADGNEKYEHDPSDQQFSSNEVTTDEHQSLQTWDPAEEGNGEGNAYVNEAYYQNYDYQGDEEQFAQDPENPEDNPEQHSGLSNFADSDDGTFTAQDQEGKNENDPERHAEYEGDYEDYPEDFNGDYQEHYQGEYEGTYEAEYDGDYQEEGEYEIVDGQNHENDISGDRQSPFNTTSPSGKRAREGDDADSLDVQHIKRTRSQ